MTFVKHPVERYDFTYDFARELGSTTIAEVRAVESAPQSGGSNLVNAGEEVAGKNVLVRWDGGEDGHDYLTTVTISASDGSVYQVGGAIAVRAIVGGDAPALQPRGRRQFAAAFPAFSSVSSASYDFWEARALAVTEPLSDCLAGDFDYATMLLTAHYLELNGRGAGATAGQVSIPGGLTSFRSASFSATLTEKAANAAISGGYGSTRYGEEFLIYLRRYAATPFLAGFVC